MCRGRAINNITLPSVILMVPSLLKSWEWIFCQTNFNPCWSHLHQNMGAVAPPLPPQSFVWGAAAALAFPAIYEVPWKSWFCVWVPSNQFKTQSNTPLIKSDLSSLQWIPQKTLLLLRPGSKLHIFHVPRSAQTCHTGQPNLVLPQTPHRKGLLGEGQFFCCSVSLPLGFLVCVVVGCLFFFFAKAVGKQCQYRYFTQLHRAILNECDKYTKLLWFCPTIWDWSRKLSLHSGDFCDSTSSPHYHFLKFSSILNGCLHVFSFGLTKLFGKLLY